DRSNIAHMTPYTEDPKDALRKLPELINEYGKLQVTKLTHRNLLHFYTLTRKDQKEKFKKQLHLPSHRKE
ncbi:hypothetical protein, partial [Campylobacter jejuni]|uniref:hypothetical protein n=1 Tax=Campylobacter jejuni TaxID=197 RepID=UPI001F099D4A